jgi:hypothetical protein
MLFAWIAPISTGVQATLAREEAHRDAVRRGAS